jgi:hypothetical protein
MVLETESKVEVKGLVTKPVMPLTLPYIKPLMPSSLAPLYGYITKPVMPPSTPV